MGDAGVEVIDDHREVVDGRAVGAGDDEVVLQRVLERALAADDVATTVTPSSGTRRRTAPAPSSVAAEAAAAVLGLERADLVRRRPWSGTRGRSSSSCSTASAWRRRARTGRSAPRPSRSRASAAPRRSGRRSRASSARGRCPRCAGRARRRWPRARSQLYSAVRALPMCRAPVGDGAKRTRMAGSMLEPPAPMLIGAHVSPAGGPAKAVARGVERGAARSRSSTRTRAPWKPREYTDEEVADFHAAMEESDVDALLIHAVYLLNCASEDPEIREKSLASLTASLRAGAALGALAVVLHPGSALKDGGVGRGARAAGEVIAEALAESETCPLHLEDTAGAGGTLGRSFEELARLIEPPAAASGSASAWTPATCWPRATTSAPPTRWRDVLDEFDRVVGLDRLGSLHINDSRRRSARTATATPASATARSAARAAPRSSPSRASRGCRACSRAPARRARASSRRTSGRLRAARAGLAARRGKRREPAQAGAGDRGQRPRSRARGRAPP